MSVSSHIFAREMTFLKKSIGALPLAVGFINSKKSIIGNQIIIRIGVSRLIRYDDPGVARFATFADRRRKRLRK